METTHKSYEYQWKNLLCGDYLLSNKKFKERAEQFLLSEVRLSPKWFKGKVILDAGSGGGRWSYGFLKLRAKVVAIDYAKSAVEATRKNNSEFSKRIKCFQANILDEKDLRKNLKENSFDMVFSWGVLHHTGNTKKAFENLVPFLKCGGKMHVYIYGRWSLGKKLALFLSNTFFPLLNLNQQRLLLSKIASSGRVHTFFDTLSPKIAHTHTLQEVVSWFRKNGFDGIRRIYPDWCPRDIIGLHIQGTKK
jgi:SAM-dependent methyltransferase